MFFHRIKVLQSLMRFELKRKKEERLNFCFFFKKNEKRTEYSRGYS